MTSRLSKPFAIILRFFLFAASVFPASVAFAQKTSTNCFDGQMNYFGDSSIFSSSLSYFQALESCRASIENMEALLTGVTIFDGEWPLPIHWWQLQDMQKRIDQNNIVNGWSENYYEIELGAECEVGLAFYRYIPRLRGDAPIAYLFRFEFEKMVQALVTYESAHKAVLELAVLQIVREGCPSDWEEIMVPWLEVSVRLSEETDYGRGWGGEWLQKG